MRFKGEAFVGVTRPHLSLIRIKDGAVPLTPPKCRAGCMRFPPPRIAGPVVSEALLPPGPDTKESAAQSSTHGMELAGGGPRGAHPIMTYGLNRSRQCRNA